MKGFKNTTRTQYSMGGSCDAYAKGGSVKGAAKVAKVMGEFKKGELHSGSKDGPKVTKPAQAKAIAMSEARKAPVKKNEGGKIGKMPPIGESVKSGNRASKMTAAEMREMEKRFSDKKRPSPADSAKSANRVSSQEAAEARHLGVFKNGGKVAKYAEGGPVGQKPGGMPAVQPLGGPVGQKPGVTPVGQPSASGSFNAMQQSLNQVGGPQAPTLASTGQSLSQFAQQPQMGNFTPGMRFGDFNPQAPMQQPQMGMTPQQQSFGISRGQQFGQQLGQMGMAGPMGSLGVGSNSLGNINQAAPPPQLGMAGDGGRLSSLQQQLQQQLNMARNSLGNINQAAPPPQLGMAGDGGRLSSLQQQLQQQLNMARNSLGNINQAAPPQSMGGQQLANRQTLQSDALKAQQSGQMPAWAAKMFQKSMSNLSGPRELMPPPQQRQLPTPVTPPNIGARNPRFKTGGLATMPKKGKC